MANCPSRKKPSRGVVATQFGLPRPALRNAVCVLFELALARLINSSLISKGLSASNFFKVRISAISCSQTVLPVGSETNQVRRRARLILPRLREHRGGDAWSLDLSQGSDASRERRATIDIDQRN